jgi:hypothetical protein
MGRTVITGGQATKAFFVEVYPERVDATHQNVNSQIELQIVYQEWLVKVLLNHVVFVFLKIVKGAS